MWVGDWHEYVFFIVQSPKPNLVEGIEMNDVAFVFELFHDSLSFWVLDII